MIANYSLHLTYDPLSSRLFLYTTLLDELPKELVARQRLYEVLLEGAILGGQIASGNVGIALREQLFVIQCTIDMNGADVDALSRFVPLYIRAVKTWFSICKNILDNPALANYTFSRKEILSEIQDRGCNARIEIEGASGKTVLDYSKEATSEVQLLVNRTLPSVSSTSSLYLAEQTIEENRLGKTWISQSKIKTIELQANNKVNDLSIVPEADSLVLDAYKAYKEGKKAYREQNNSKALRFFCRAKLQYQSMNNDPHPWKQIEKITEYEEAVRKNMG